MNEPEYQRMFESEDRYWWFVARRQLALRLLDRHGKKQPVGAVLDLGCGTGAALMDLGSRGRGFGIDFSQIALDYCRKRNLTRVVRGDGSRIPFQDEVFDAILALDTLEHIEDHRAALAEMLRVMKPGAVAIVSVPAFSWLWGPHDVALMHYRRFTARQLVAESKQVGFSIVQASYSVFLLFPVVVAMRMLDRLKQGPPAVHLPQVPEWLNRSLIRLMQVESNSMPLPWGSSVIAVLQKPPNDVSELSV